LTPVREGDIKIGIPEVSGGNIPEPFNENDERVWMNRILKDMCRETRDCFYPSEFILNEEIQHVKAYDNPHEKERALSDESSPYYKIAKHSLEQLVKKEVVTKETRSDPTDGKKYITYCKTSLLNALCKEISKYDLPDIDTILTRLRNAER
jgi:hypothetical protein